MNPSLTTMTSVFDKLLKKVIVDSEQAVVDIQMQVMEASNVSEAQKKSLRELTDAASHADTTLPIIDRIQKMMKENEDLAGSLMPIITSLQFQDRLRQELESVLTTLKAFLDVTSHSIPESEVLPFDKEFWKRCAAGFTNIESRTAFLKAALGDDWESVEKDLRATRTTSNDDFFL